MVHYFFIKHDEFVSRMEAGDFLETAEFCGNYYGTPRSLVEAACPRGRCHHGHEIRGLIKRARDAWHRFIFLHRRRRNSERG